MTLQQLKYAILIAETGTYGEAAKKLYISQPSLSLAIKELEDELHIKICNRSTKGASITEAGADFIKGAKQILLELELLESKFSNKAAKRQRFSVSTQHYTFASLAFAKLVNECADIEYELALNETKTMDVIADVKNLRSELGIIYISRDNESVINKIVNESRLKFTELFITRPYILVGAHNPLAQFDMVHIDDLAEYPCVSFIQDDLAPRFFSEEVINILEQRKSLKISDRGALADLLYSTGAYVVSTGVYLLPENTNKIAAVPLAVNGVDNVARVGFIRHKDIICSPICEMFCEILTEIIQTFLPKDHVKRYF
jgi:DNA-binding transcriptional LysR family regulator